MLIASVLAFFIFIFLLATITVAIAWMAFLKRKAEETDAGDTGAEEYRPAEEESVLFRNERLSSLNFWDSLLVRFDFVEILKSRLLQSGLDWSVGRVTLGMLLGGTVAFLLCWKFLPVWIALAVALGRVLLPTAIFCEFAANASTVSARVFPMSWIRWLA
ncbi:MAG TPA: hypothetical protein VFW44_07745, partial [Bryobacteraceae bacterium]|nr:hypothetical protein [Bryobacteraceae bacterium]